MEKYTLSLLGMNNNKDKEVKNKEEQEFSRLLDTMHSGSMYQDDDITIIAQNIYYMLVDEFANLRVKILKKLQESDVEIYNNIAFDYGRELTDEDIAERTDEAIDEAIKFLIEFFTNKKCVEEFKNTIE